MQDNWVTTWFSAQSSELKHRRSFKLRRSCFITLNLSNVREFFWELSSKGLYLSLKKKEKENRCLAFTFSMKREIKTFHIVVVQWRQRNVQKCLMHVQSCCFANLNLLLVCRCRCRRRRRCLRSRGTSWTVTLSSLLSIHLKRIHEVQKLISKGLRDECI